MGCFLRVHHQLLCVDTVHFDRLGVEAVRGFPAHLEAPLTAGVVGVRHPLLYRFPLKLCEHDTDIQHGPAHRGRGVKLFRGGNKFHIVLLEQFHHICEIQNGTADTVKFVDNDFRNQALLDVPHQLLKLRAVCVLAAVPFVSVFPATTAFQFVFAKFNLAFNGDGEQVASLSDTQVDILRDILWEMNDVNYSTHTEAHEVEFTTTNDDGEEETTTETVAEAVLTITITHKTAAEMAGEYHFNSCQNEYLDLMMQPDNQNLWAQLLGGLVPGGGQIINPDTDWVPTGELAWPLPQSFTITSHFGYRKDPFTGELEYHSGTDIAAPNGTQILAAAAGTVAIANGTDSWGGSYGYHIKIDHGNGLETLYAHCSGICVTPGQQVQQGEVIGFVGSTGNSTGNHLHLEAWVNGVCTDVMDFFST